MKYSDRFDNKKASEIKQLLFFGVAASEIARCLNVSYHRIYAIEQGISYKDTPPATLSDADLEAKYFWIHDTDAFKKLSETQVRDIKTLIYYYEYPVADLARAFEVNYYRIYHISNGTTYANLTPSNLGIEELHRRYPNLDDIAHNVLNMEK